MSRAYNGLEIAVIGMACRFPKSPGVRQYWENLVAGRECITIDAPAGTDGRIKAKGILEDNECFDFEFFQYSPKEAGALDPQVRVLHECTWAALEEAGYDPFAYPGLIGNFVGASTNPVADLQPYFRNNQDEHEVWSELLYSDKDFIATRISHKLNLKGPSLTVDTACSTSLTAIDLAVQGLLTGKCDLAVAGGVSITYHDEEGYVYKEGFISAPDGHCRAFDERARGTVTGNGVGVVVLKRLEEALRDGDDIQAVILGSAVNNDGYYKQGFTAPSREGQIDVLRTAHQVAEVAPETIGYVEAHGTGTQLGDMIEIDALKIAFNTTRKNFCAIGAVKTNLGHLDAAAGIAGFIKTVLILKHKRIPPTVHFNRPNPKFGLEESPFYINNTAVDWASREPRRAGVSSFGIGGTNVHIILEEAPARAAGAPVDPGVFLFSARTEPQLAQVVEHFARFLGDGEGAEAALDRVAYTLRHGRRHFKHRLGVLAGSPDALKKKLEAYQPGAPAEKSKTAGKTVFMFSGQGSQYVNMTRGLYESCDFYRNQLDACLEILRAYYPIDLKEVLFADAPPAGESLLHHTLYTQPLLVAVEYSLAKLLMHCGVTPDIVIGHSIGEYTAACIAGTLSLPDTLHLVCRRARLMAGMPAGAMLAVSVEKEKLREVLPPGLSVAAENAKRNQVVSGPEPLIDAFAATLDGLRWGYARLNVSHAFHSPMMQPVARQLEEEAAQFTFSRPALPFIANLTGRPAGDEIAGPSYWGAQMTGTVRFADCVGAAVAEGATRFMEIGPGTALQSMVKTTAGSVCTCGFIRNPREEQPDYAFLVNRLLKRWEEGAPVAWEALVNTPAERVSLPTYPFAKKHLPIRRIDFKRIGDTGARQPAAATETLRYYAPTWNQSIAPDPDPEGQSSCVLIFTADDTSHAGVIDGIKAWRRDAVIVALDASFAQVADGYFSIDPSEPAHYERVLAAYPERRFTELKVVFAGTPGDDAAAAKALESFTLLLKVVINSERFARKHVYAVTCNLHNVLNEPTANAGYAALLGPLKVTPIEHKELHCVNVDLDRHELRQHSAGVLPHLIRELGATPGAAVVAIRRGIRWTQHFQPLTLKAGPSKLKPGGTYLVTGGLGGMAFKIAGYLMAQYQAHVVLLGRSGFLHPAAWRAGDDAATGPKYRLRKETLLGLAAEGKGSVATCQADLADPSSVRGVLAELAAARGGLDGVFHTAGLVDYGGVLQRRSFASFGPVMAPKVAGTRNLVALCGELDLRPDFLLLFSSNGNTFYSSKYGQAAYNAANEFLDAVASAPGRDGATAIRSINWNDWYEVGMTVDTLEDKLGHAGGADLAAKIDDGISPAEGLEAIERILQSPHPRVIVSRKDVPAEIAEMEALLRTNKEELLGRLVSHAQVQTPLFEKPVLDAVYQSPRNRTEGIIVEQLSNYLKYDNIGVFDNFFELGLSSLDLVQLSTRLSEALNASISVTTLFTYPTVDALVGRLNPAPAGPQPAAPPAEAEDLESALKVFD